MGCRCSKYVSVASLPASLEEGASALATKEGDRDMRNEYRLGAVLGSGSFGQVRVCLRRKTGEQFACKIMAKGNQPLNYVSMFRNEIAILRMLDHPNVVKLVDTFEDRNFLYAIMEKCDGGELFSKIVHKRRFVEKEAAKLCINMLAAIEYVHSLGVIHRDVKAENFLFDKSYGPAARLVLIDFGMSIKTTDPRPLRQVCGSPHYVAPELIKRSYNKEVDMWALGVVLFLMLYGRYPFEGGDQKQIAHRILRSEPDYQRSAQPPSPMAVSFLRALLNKDPTCRMTPAQATVHPWLEHHIGSKMPLTLPTSGRVGDAGTTVPYNSASGWKEKRLRHDCCKQKSWAVLQEISFDDNTALCYPGDRSADGSVADYCKPTLDKQVYQSSTSTTPPPEEQSPDLSKA